MKKTLEEEENERAEVGQEAGQQHGVVPQELAEVVVHREVGQLPAHKLVGVGDGGPALSTLGK